MEDEAIELLQSTGYMLAGMALDPAIPHLPREACKFRSDRIFAFLESIDAVPFSQ